MATLTPDAQGQDEAARRRFAEREGERRACITRLREGGIAAAEEQERIDLRLRRVAALLPSVPTVPPPGEAGARLLEKIVGTSDYVDPRWLEQGLLAARAVCRIHVRDAATGEPAGFGTGSLVTPSLVLTNHHVLGDPATAAASVVEFDYQDFLTRPLPNPPRIFALDPSRVFLADEELDFALVAVAGAPAAVAEFGHNPLSGAEGKAVIGEFVTIVQHPGGEKKRIALRDNRVVDRLELYLHYEADTEPGSSGSPVFNDQWEIVALHHASTPMAPEVEAGGFLNEGIRISRIVRFVQGAADALPEGARALVAQVGGGPLVPASPVVVVPGAGSAAAAEPEAVTIAPGLEQRPGFDRAFLGVDVPPPVPGAALEGVAGDELRYEHFSVAMHRGRRLALWTAVNIDGRQEHRLRRATDRWFFDPRIPQDQQVGEEVYASNPLDRGHLVRRLDPAWGATEADAQRANNDTFHFTNCTPQHEDFNQNKTTWAGLEDYLLENAQNRDLRVCVFTGPVFAPDDDEYRGVQLPRQFWKVAAMVKRDGTLSATAYLLSQESLIAGLELAPTDFSYGAYETFQVQLTRIEALTGLSFGALSAHDPLTQNESLTTTSRVVRGPDSLVV